MGSRFQHRYQLQNPATAIIDFFSVRIYLGLLLKDRKKSTGGKNGIKRRDTQSWVSTLDSGF